MDLSRRVASVAAIAMYLLIVLGAAVRVTDSGLGCPDWPLCYGGALPPVTYHALLEFAHRALASLVTLLVIAVLVLAWRSGDRGRRTGAIAATALLALQILLGGVTVLAQNAPATVAIHLAVALATLAALLSLVVGPGFPGPASQSLVQVRNLTLAMAAGIFILVLSGALVTSVPGADTACPAFPICSATNRFPTTGAASVQMLHRTLMFLVALLGLYTVFAIERLTRHRMLRRVARAVALAFALQVGVGIFMVTHGSPAQLEGLHVAVAALVWSSAVLLAVVARRTCDLVTPDEVQAWQRQHGAAAGSVA
ncbi:MAG: COX15/CtaA family protein [Candidatus Dormibacteria bacterium]